MEKEMNALQKSYKINNFTLILSLHYLLINKKHKPHILKSIFHSQLQEWVRQVENVRKC